MFLNFLTLIQYPSLLKTLGLSLGTSLSWLKITRASYRLGTTLRIPGKRGADWKGDFPCSSALMGGCGSRPPDCLWNWKRKLSRTSACRHVQGALSHPLDGWTVLSTSGKSQSYRQILYCPDLIRSFSMKEIYPQKGVPGTRNAHGFLKKNSIYRI